MSPQVWVWSGFVVFICLMLYLDLGVLHRKSHSVSLKTSLLHVCIYVFLAVCFGVGVLYWRGAQKGGEFFAGYLVELSLSVDNLFVFLLIFNYFGVRPEYQYRALFWGIIGAVVLRLAFIVAGVALVNTFDLMIYVFGAFLIWTAVKMITQNKIEIHPERNPLIKLFRRIVPVTPDFAGDRFFVRHIDRWHVTPLFIVLLVIDFADVVFAVDSIPAIIGFTRDNFIIFSSNVFAILGLRALYFSLAGIMRLFHYLHYGLAAILGFVGLKMVGHHAIDHWLSAPVQIGISLGLIVLILGLSILASMLWPKPLEADIIRPADDPEAVDLEFHPRPVPTVSGIAQAVGGEDFSGK